jgi:hypothetical protein
MIKVWAGPTVPPAVMAVGIREVSWNVTGRFRLSPTLSCWLTLGERPPSQRFGPDRQATPLIVIEPQSSRADLSAQNSILLAQIYDDLLMLVVHPTGNGDQQ